MADNADNTRNHELDSNLLAFAAARAVKEPHLFSRIIERYIELNNLAEKDLCISLSCDRDTLNHLRLCGRPDSDPIGFGLDIQRIVDRLGLDAGVLAALVREVDAAEVFGEASRSVVTPFSFTSGMLQAARDRDEAEVEETENEDRQSRDLEIRDDIDKASGSHSDETHLEDSDGQS